jgi:hypothetical protein
MGAVDLMIGDETEGQTAAFDATIFLAILLVASALMVGVSNHLSEAEDANSFDDLHKYTVRLASAVLGSTVPNASYMDIEENEIVRVDASVLDMIIEELLLLQADVPAYNFEGEGRYNERVSSVLSSLLDEDRYGFTLSGGYLEKTLLIGQASPLSERSAHTTEIFQLGETEPITITLTIWAC